MASVRATVLLLSLLPLAASSGCVTLYSKTEVIRAEEPQMPVRFETAKASRLFHEELARRSNHADGTTVGIPFVTFYTKERVLAESAFFNEQVRKCDTDQDGVITEREAMVYAGWGALAESVSGTQPLPSGQVPPASPALVPDAQQPVGKSSP
jgi:hypothetical protein